MLLLHVSDIHFRHPDCTTGLDPELPYRTLLVRDAHDQVERLGPVDAILVTGDIAYHALIPEYKAAALWLRELAEACRCELGRVFVVPGNHDIDWNTIRNSVNVRNAQAAIAHATAEARERELMTQLSDTEVGRSLFSPLANYNDFAAEFNCQVYPNRPLWRQEMDLDERTTLRIHGLTSTILSGAGIPTNTPDRKGDLYLSRFQTVLNPEEGVVNLVMCHHPPDWFLDTDQIEDAINGRSLLHMFGHKHRQRITREENYVRFSAGAVNPDPVEVGWEPGYNLVELSIAEPDGQRYLDIKAHLRRWQIGPPDGFVAKNNVDGQEVYAKRLHVHGLRSHAPQPAHGPSVPVSVVTGQAAPAAMIEPAVIEAKLDAAVKLEAV